MRSAVMTWQAWAVLSAVFAALTAIFAKQGVGDIPADVATFLRTLVIVTLLGAILAASGEWRLLPEAFSGHGVSGRAALFLLLSGLATGASWLCYFRALQLAPVSRVAPIDKLCVAIA